MGEYTEIKKIIIFLAFAVILISTQVYMADAVKLKDFGRSKVVIKCLNGDTSIPDVDIEIYKLRNGIPAEKVAELQTNLHGCATLKLPPGEYAVQAYLDGESGYHGYKKFKIDTNNPWKHYEVVVNMKPNSDHSYYIDLTPTIENMIIKENTTPVAVISAVPGKEGEEDIPILLKNQVLSERDNWIRVDLKELDPVTREILMKYQEELLASNTSNEAHNSFETKDVGDAIWFNFYIIGVVEVEETYNVWHPIALIDSEWGLTHSFDLSVYYGEKFTITSEIIYSGISASGTYTHESTFEVSFTPITVADGAVVTYRSEFRHVYQKGSIYFVFWRLWKIGEFEREFIDKWYVMSYQTKDCAELSETRETYLGEWRSSAEADVTMTDSQTYSGSIGVSVKREDVFGSVKITLTFKYGTKAHHHYVYNQPGPLWYVKFYSGRLFDINTYQYYAGGGGGGCPILYVYDGSEYVEEGLLDIHNPDGNDVTTRHILTVTPKAVNHVYLLRLVEHPQTHSYIDQVKLYAVLESREIIELPLISAIHSEYGNVLPQLLFSDDWRTETIGADFNDGISQSIELKFLAMPEIAPQLKVVGFIFVIEGYNPYVKR